MEKEAYELRRLPPQASPAVPQPGTAPAVAADLPQGVIPAAEEKPAPEEIYEHKNTPFRIQYARKRGVSMHVRGKPRIWIMQNNARKC